MYSVLAVSFILHRKIIFNRMVKLNNFWLCVPCYKQTIMSDKPCLAHEYLIYQSTLFTYTPCSRAQRNISM